MESGLTGVHLTKLIYLVNSSSPEEREKLEQRSKTFVSQNKHKLGGNEVMRLENIWREAIGGEPPHMDLIYGGGYKTNLSILAFLILIGGFIYFLSRKPKPEIPEIKPKPEIPEIKPKPEIPEIKPKPEIPEIKPKPEIPEIKPDVIINLKKNRKALFFNYNKPADFNPSNYGIGRFYVDLQKDLFHECKFEYHTTSVDERGSNALSLLHTAHFVVNPWSEDFIKSHIGEYSMIYTTPMHNPWSSQIAELGKSDLYDVITKNISSLIPILTDDGYIIIGVLDPIETSFFNNYPDNGSIIKTILPAELPFYTKSDIPFEVLIVSFFANMPAVNGEFIRFYKIRRKQDTKEY